MCKWLYRYTLGAAVFAGTALGFSPAQAQFACGDGLATYQVHKVYSDGVVEPLIARAVRCVKFVDRRSFSWYGEGEWGNLRYRHLGYAIGPPEVGTAAANIFTGSAADLASPGGRPGNYPGTLNISIPNRRAWDENTPAAEIRVRGAWSENWILRRVVLTDDPQPERHWSGLPAISDCGPFMRRFIVNTPTDDDDIRQISSNPNSWGVRCLLDADGKRPAVWYGIGAWPGGRYRHIGTAFFGVFGPQWGASD